MNRNFEGSKMKADVTIVLYPKRKHAVTIAFKLDIAKGDSLTYSTSCPWELIPMLDYNVYNNPMKRRIPVHTTVSFTHIERLK